MWSGEGWTRAGNKRGQPGESDIWRCSHLWMVSRSAEHHQCRITPQTESRHSTLSSSSSLHLPAHVPAVSVIIRAEWNSAAVDGAHHLNENSQAWRKDILRHILSRNAGCMHPLLCCLFHNESRQNKSAQTIWNPNLFFKGFFRHSLCEAGCP